MIENLSCADVRPRLFALLEDGIAPDERRALTLHLALCTDCRAELERESRLTASLRERPAASVRPRTPLLVRAAAAVLVAAALFVTVHAIGDREAYGSIAPARLEPTLRLENGEVRPLGSHNHLEVPANEKDTVELIDTGTLAVVGPAVLELDRTPEQWKLVLLRGQVEASIADGATLLVTSAFGLRQLGPGRHLVAATPAFFAGTSRIDETPAELLQAGYRHFFATQMPAAEASFRAVCEHPDATAEEKGRALFYLAAAVGRQDRFEDALALQSEWMDLHPDDSSFTYVLLFQGIYLRRLGREQEARAAWQEILAREPGSELAGHAQSMLDEPAQARAAPRSPSGYEPGRLLPIARPLGPRLVVAFGLDPQGDRHRAFREVAAEAARFHQAERLDVPDGDVERLLAALRERAPSAVLFVLPPEALDVRLHRQVLLASGGLDEDVFPDFEFGWLTARDGAALAELWQRTVATHRKGLSARRWTSTFVTSGMKSCEYPGYGLDLAVKAGFDRRAFAFAESRSDPAVLEFVARTLPQLEEAGVLTMTGNGDPQGIWLFDGDRNARPETHWPFDPARVGEDPKGEMPRILAARYAELKLARPVVWSGTCHSAATHRVFVEGDIVSTFGRSDRIEVYEMPLEESLGLGLIQGGAVALLAPIGANHGYAVDLEAEFALARGASLGETIKSTWDDVFLQARGTPKLVLPVAGATSSWHDEPIMQGGGANRALLGDPLLRPFQPTKHPTERSTVRRTGERTVEVVVEWDRGHHVRSWNLYADATGAIAKRLWACVELDDVIPRDVAARLTAELRVTGAKDRALAGFELTHAEPEVWSGRRLLHLQASAPDGATAEHGVRATFTIRWEPERAP